MLNPEYSTINFIEVLPDMASLGPSKVNLLIIYDIMHEMNEVVTKLFTIRSHHMNKSVLLFTKNIFHQNKHYITVSRNAHYMVLFKNAYRKYITSSYANHTVVHVQKLIHFGNCSLKIQDMS